MRIIRVALLAAAATLGGCYKVTVVTATTPSPTVVDKPWQLSLVEGLVPPPELNVKEQCPQGLSKVVTQRSFLNSVVGMLSSGLITPMQVTVTCAQ
jgi:hypothetical protein